MSPELPRRRRKKVDEATETRQDAPLAADEQGQEPPAPSKPARSSGNSTEAEGKQSGKPKAPAKQKAASGSKPAKATHERARPTAEVLALRVSARARYVRVSPRKARMVCVHIRGKSVQDARAVLRFTPRAVASDWSKLLESAIANAEHNHELLAEDLFVREVYADAGPTIKRFRPRAMGRATPIRKRTSHLTITLSVGR